MTIYKALLVYINNDVTHFLQISEKGVIQLHRNSLNMTNAELSRDWRTFCIDTWVNNSKTTFKTIFSRLNWQAVERSAVVGTWNSSNHKLCIFMPLRFKLFQALTTAGHFRVMSLSRHFHVKSVLASFFLNATTSTTFSLIWHSLRSLLQVSVFFSLIIRGA